VASNLIAAGMGLLQVAHSLGHSNAAMVSRIYGHIVPNDHKRAVSIMYGLLESTGTKLQP
jgi:integrase